MGLGTGEIILIIFVVTVVFGATKLPALGDGLGRAIGSFKRAISGKDEIEASIKQAVRDGAAQPEKKESAASPDKSQ